MKTQLNKILALTIVCGFALSSLIGLVFAQEIGSTEINQELESYSDDFSSDSGSWQYVGSAYRDQTKQYLVLAEPTSETGGVAFFNAPVKGSFTASFSYKIGGGSGADGITMFFYKQAYTSPDSGGSMAFSIKEGSTLKAVPGYGIEFDGWQNIRGDFQQIIGCPQNQQGDPSENHIALIKDCVGNHLTYVNDPRTDDNNWHKVKVSVDVQESSVSVFVDQQLVLQWTGELDRTYDCFGFSGASGGATNWHIIDDFSITSQSLKKPSLTLSCRSATSYSGFNVEIEGNLAYNETAIPNAPILLSYSVTGGKTWQDLTLVYTGEDGSYSATWLPSVTGNFLLKAIYEGADEYLGAVEVVNFAVAQFSEKTAFSVSSNSTVSSLTFDSEKHELRFTVEGEKETAGYADVYIAKSLIGNIANIKTYLDNQEIEYSATSADDFWQLHFTYQHSTHEISVNLGLPPAEIILGNPIALTAIIGGTLAIPIALAFVVVRKRRSKKII